MKIHNYTFATDPSSKHNVLVWLDHDLQYCGFAFDVPQPTEWDEYPNPVRSTRLLVNALGRTDLKLNDLRAIDWIGFELLRRYINGSPIPADGECGIERHFRELAEAS